MEDSFNDIENNRRLAVIEESINRTLLYDDVKNKDTCKYGSQIFMVIGGIIIICFIIIIMLLIYKKIN